MRLASSTMFEASRLSVEGRSIVMVVPSIYSVARSEQSNYRGGQSALLLFSIARAKHDL